VVEVFHLKNITKDWLSFLSLLRRVSQDTSCVLVHGVSSCDLGCCNKIVYDLSKMLKWNKIHA
jgi:hypothetical protein